MMVFHLSLAVAKSRKHEMETPNDQMFDHIIALPKNACLLLFEAMAASLSWCGFCRISTNSVLVLTFILKGRQHPPHFGLVMINLNHSFSRLEWDFFLLFSPFIWSRVRPNRFAPLFDFCPHAPTVVSQPAGPIDVLPWPSVKSTAAQLQIVYLQTRMPIIKYIRLQMSVLLFCKVTFSRGHTSWGPKRIILARRMLLDDNGKLSALKTFHISAVPPSRSIDAVRINCKVARVHLRLVCRVPAKLFGILCRACADSRLSFNPAPRCSF